MQIVSFVAELIYNTLLACLLFWAIARVFEVWLNVYDRIKKEKEAGQD